MMKRYFGSCAMVLLLSCLAWGASPRREDSKQSELRTEAKITMAEAQKKALAKEPGKLKSKELEKEKGKLIYSFDIKTKSSIHEVNVDAISGDVVADTTEDAAAEAKEQQDKKTDRQWSENRRWPPLPAKVLRRR
ncbi:MAG: hypothetical protein NVS1B11_30720 [Terriglobales bacterium]